MIRYIGKRLLLGIFVLFGVSIMIFILSRVVPGDPGRLALGPRATQEAVDEMNRQLYMDCNIFIGCGIFLWAIWVFLLSPDAL